MREIAPSFYERFQCRAGACRHSCCRGWEIDVDVGSAQRWFDMPGTLGAALREALEEGEEGWHFRLTEDERCPMLRPDGLCRLILEGGEEALCDICALHPRFFFELGDWDCAGLGLCCEAAADLLLGTPELGFVTETGERMDLSALLERRDFPVDPEALRFRPVLNTDGIGAILLRYSRCEPIDAAWTEELAALDRDPAGLLREAERFWADCDRSAFDRILGYILYRQLEWLPETGLAPLLDYAGEAAEIVLLRAAHFGDLPEQLRRWSEQTEYSTENVRILIEKST